MIIGKEKMPYNNRFMILFLFYKNVKLKFSSKLLQNKFNK